LIFLVLLVAMFVGVHHAEKIAHLSRTEIRRVNDVGSLRSIEEDAGIGSCRVLYDSERIIGERIISGSCREGGQGYGKMYPMSPGRG
jgi:hypothetical protein